MRTPEGGKLALQVASGVVTTSLQPVKSEERRKCKGSNKIENTPDALAVTVETPFPAPHSSWTVASTNKINKNNNKLKPWS